jgi:hypothetical protein
MSETLRLRASSRAAGALVGAIVTVIGTACIAVNSGREIDLELWGIIMLGGAGVWLLLSAIAAGFSSARRDRKRAAAASVADPAGSQPDLRDSARDAAESVKTADERA